MSNFRNIFMVFLLSAAVMVFAFEPGQGRILVRADKVTNKVGPLTTGACLEDVTMKSTVVYTAR
jgi:hypothetical protein